MLLILFVLSTFVHYVFCATDFCQFDDGGYHFDLNRFPQSQISTSLGDCDSQVKGATLLMQLCDNLQDFECPSKNSTGPGNACEYQLEKGKCWWVGGVKKVKTSSYDEKTSTFSILYRGLEQEYELRRSIKVEFQCVRTRSRETTIECVDAIEDEEEKIYLLRVTSTNSCPSISSSATLFFEVFGFGFLVVACLVCYYGTPVFVFWVLWFYRKNITENKYSVRYSQKMLSGIRSLNKKFLGNLEIGDARSKLKNDQKKGGEEVEEEEDYYSLY